MSAPNAARALPPGDRDEIVPLPDDPSRDPLARREVAAAPPGGAVSKELLPGLALVIDRCGPALDEAQMALGDLKLAKTQGDVAVFKSAAHRLASLANHVARTAKAYQPRENEVQQKE